jgi:hypothetical protein
MSRTKKHPYTGAKRVSKNCRNHGSCEWCRGNRLHNTERKQEQCKQLENEKALH